MCRLLAMFWYQREVITSKNGYHGPHFKATRRATQVGLISTTLFNLIVNNVVQNWLMLTVEYRLVTQEGLGYAIGRCLVLFYADNGVVGLWDPEWLQDARNVLI